MGLYNNLITNTLYPLLTNLTNVSDIAAGVYHSLVLINGKVYSFGTDIVI